MESLWTYGLSAPEERHGETHYKYCSKFQVSFGFLGAGSYYGCTIVLSANTHTGFSAIADAVYAGDLTANYHPAEGAILNQYAWNLFWFGSVTAA